MNKAVCGVGAGGLTIICWIGAIAVMAGVDYLLGGWVLYLIDWMPNWLGWLVFLLSFLFLAQWWTAFYRHCRRYHEGAASVNQK